jgi:hypothetical protein
MHADRAEGQIHARFVVFTLESAKVAGTFAAKVPATSFGRIPGVTL